MTLRIRAFEALLNPSYSRLTSPTGPGHDPFYPISAVSSAGFLVLCSGVRGNLRIANPDTAAGSTTPPTSPLVIRAPSVALSTPLFSWSGGAIFGDDYAYRYRYKNSQTGEVSGLSPFPPEFWNLGRANSAQSEDWTGQDADIELEGTDEPEVDTLQLFRNTSSQLAVFYLIDEASNPGSGSFVSFTDSASDEDLFFNETDGLAPNPTYLAGRPWSCAKVHAHPTGRVMLYGLRRFGQRQGLATWMDGTNRIEGVLDDDEVLIGMRVTQGGTGIEGEEYRIVDVHDGGYTVFPEIDLKGTAGQTYLTFDDRDGRTIYVSLPGKPWSYNLLEVMSVGHDQDDAILHIESFNRQTLVFTRRKVYLLLNDLTEAPHLTYTVTILANEGTFGLRSTVQTPFGMVFVNERGVRLLGDLVQPLGSLGPVNDFLPEEQFAQLDIATAREVSLDYDPIEHLLHMSYVPRNQSSYTEEMVYDPEVGAWRGPWRRRMYVWGEVTEPGGYTIPVFGDDQGNIQLDQVQSLDVVNPSTKVLSSIAKVRSFHSFDLRDNPDPDNTNSIIGAPVLVEVATGAFTLGWISGVENLGTNNTLVLSEQITGLLEGQQVYIGYVDWNMKTAYFDGGEPVRPKEFGKFRTRFEKTGVEECNFRVSVAREGEDFETAEYSEVVKCLPDTVFADLRVSMNARSFQIDLRGISDMTIPKITGMVADISVRRGD